MSLFFANPWGLAALLSVPALVAIHCLQEKSRRVRTSTLFLLEHARPTSTGGFRLERFRGAVPFWMQLIAALAVSWLLADPRWIRADSRQTVVVVLDASASMQAFREPTLAALEKRLADWRRTAARTDWHLLETGPRRPPLYAGPSLDALLAAARERWRPTLGTHPFSEQLATAASLAPPGSGGVILVTDRPTAAAADVAVLSVGEPFANVGISAGEVVTRDGKTVWRALVTNHGAVATSRDLVVRAGGGATGLAGEPLSAPAPVTLTPGQSRLLEGAWPEGDRDRLVIQLSPDRFTGDDTVPLVKPVPRVVHVATRLAGPAGDLLARMLLCSADVAPAAAAADADLVVDALAAECGTSAVLAAAGPADRQAGLADDGTADDAGPAPAQPVVFDAAFVAAEEHPLVRDLGWGALLSGPPNELDLAPTDEPLLWKAGRPLAVLRGRSLPSERGRTRVESLLLAFDPGRSTAATTPALVVMLGRFVDRVRREIRRSWAGNFETDERIDLPGGGQARAPQSPGFFSVPLDDPAAAPAVAPSRADERPVLVGAAQFSDVRECDFRTAGPVDTLDGLRRERALGHSVEDAWAPVWVAVAVAALCVAWGWRAAR